MKLFKAFFSTLLACLAVSSSLYAVVRPEFIPLASRVTPIGLVYLLDISKGSQKDNKK